MNERQAKYLQKSLGATDNKWAAMALAKLAGEMLEPDRQALVPILRAALIEKVQTKLDKLISLKAPEVILENERRILEKARAGKVSPLQILARASKKDAALAESRRKTS